MGFRLIEMPKAWRGAYAERGTRECRKDRPLSTGCARVKEASGRQPDSKLGSKCVPVQCCRDHRRVGGDDSRSFESQPLDVVLRLENLSKKLVIVLHFATAVSTKYGEENGHALLQQF